MGAREWLLLLALSALWGGAFFLGKVALAELPPLLVVAGRVAPAAAALLAAARVGGLALPRSPRFWGAALLMGAANQLLPYTLLFWGQTRLPSGLAAILTATTPVFTVLLAHRLTPDERLTPARAAGVALGLAAVAVIAGPGALAGPRPEALAQLACLGAALAYAGASIFGRRFGGQPPLVAAAGQVTATALLAVPLALAVEGVAPLVAAGPRAWLALAGLALPCTALAFLLYFRILARAGATNLVLVTLLIPATAALLGAAFLGERLAAHHLAGLGLIAASLAVIDGRPLAFAAGRLRGRPAPAGAAGRRGAARPGRGPAPGGRARGPAPATLPPRAA
jgi:drug/metabolite transporter (DMT)-like permease